MVDKKQIDMHEFRTATAEVGDTVPVFANGQRVTGVTLIRNEAGDLTVHQQVDQPAADAPALDEVAAADTEEERRTNDPASLTEVERAELTRLEKLGGVEDHRVGDTGSEGDPL